MLDRLERLDRPLDVHRVGQRDVDRVDVRRRQQLLVGAERLGDPVLVGERAGSREVTRAHGDDRGIRRHARTVDQLLRDARGREDAPARHLPVAADLLREMASTEAASNSTRPLMMNCTPDFCVTSGRPLAMIATTRPPVTASYMRPRPPKSDVPPITAAPTA